MALEDQTPEELAWTAQIATYLAENLMGTVALPDGRMYFLQGELLHCIKAPEGYSYINCSDVERQAIIEEYLKSLQ